MSELEQPTQKKDTIDTQVIINAILQKIKYAVLKYAPLVLFGLWAVLLWALYAAKVTAAEIFEDFSVNLYQALKNEMFEDLFPVLKALSSFAIISNVYIVVLSLIYWKGGNEAKLFATWGGLLLQIAVFICALILRKKFRIRYG